MAAVEAEAVPGAVVEVVLAAAGAAVLVAADIQAVQAVPVALTVAQAAEADHPEVTVIADMVHSGGPQEPAVRL